MVSFNDNQIIKLLLDEMFDQSILILPLIVKSRKGHYSELFNKLIKQGYLKVRVDGEMIKSNT